MKTITAKELVDNLSRYKNASLYASSWVDSCNGFREEFWGAPLELVSVTNNVYSIAWVGKTNDCLVKGFIHVNINEADTIYIRSKDFRNLPKILKGGNV